jgi:hypothetical protein
MLTEIAMAVVTSRGRRRRMRVRHLGDDSNVIASVHLESINADILLMCVYHVCL